VLPFYLSGGHWTSRNDHQPMKMKIALYRRIAASPAPHSQAERGSGLSGEQADISADT